MPEARPAVADATVAAGRRRTLLHVATIVAVTAVAYAGSFDGAFVSDDLQAVDGNPLLSSLDWANVRAIFTSFDGPNYMPVKVLSLAVDQALFGPAPAGYHLTNLLLHVGCGVAIYAILRFLSLPPLAACLAAALWAVHPLQVESVAWISERKNVLSGLFFLAGFGAWLAFSERGGWAVYGGFILLYVLAMLSKMNTMVLPAVCLAYEVTWRRRLRRRELLAVAPAFGLAALIAWYNLRGNPIHGEVWYGGSRVVTWLSTAVVPFRYLWHALVPIDVRPYYDVPLRGSPLDPPVLLALLGLVALGGGTVWLAVRGRREAFWILWAAITLLPMLNVVVPFRSLMNDRHVYLALLGPLALAAMWLADLRSPSLRRLAAGAAALAIVACTALSLRQVEIWSDPLTLWCARARTPLLAPDPVYRRPNAEAHVACLERGLAAAPGDPALLNNLGGLDYEAGRNDAALARLKAAADAAPEHATILLNLGRAHLHAGRLAEAGVALERAAELRPYEFLPRSYLLRYYLRVGDAARARRAYAAALGVHPTAMAARSLERERQALARLEARE